MKYSAAAIFPRFYSQPESESAVRYVAQVDPMLLADGTFFVLEIEGELVACGGWSRRDRLYTGSGESIGDGRLLDPAAEPAKVRAMFVRDDWTRRGLGRRILEECKAAAGLSTTGADGNLAWRAPLRRSRLFAARADQDHAGGRGQARVRVDGEGDRVVPRQGRSTPALCSRPVGRRVDGEG